MKDDLYVYLVDDSPTIIQSLRTCVKHEFNLRLRTFNSAEECLEMIRKRVPDILICDYNLDPQLQNRMNGDHLLKTIRKEYPKLPVIMYSSTKDFEMMTHLMKLGAVDFITRDSKFHKNLTDSLGNTLNQIKKSREDHHTKRGFTVITLFMVSGIILFYFINVDFLIYLLLTVGVTMVVFLLYGYYRNFEFLNRKIRQLGKLFSKLQKKEILIYVVDDSLIYRLMITNALHLERKFLHPYTINIKMFPSADQCLKEMQIIPPQIIILDYFLEETEDHNKGMNGAKMLNKVKEIAPEVAVIMISSNSDMSVAAHLMRDGAKDYIVKDKLWANKIRSATHKIIKSSGQKNNFKNRITYLSLN